MHVYGCLVGWFKGEYVMNVKGDVEEVGIEADGCWLMESNTDDDGSLGRDVTILYTSWSLSQMIPVLDYFWVRSGSTTEMTDLIVPLISQPPQYPQFYESIGNHLVNHEVRDHCNTKSTSE